MRIIYNLSKQCIYFWISLLHYVTIQSTITLLPLYRLGLDCYQPPPCFIINTKETMKFILTAVTLLASTAAVAAKEPKVLRGPVLVRYINSIVGLTIANEQTHTSYTSY